MHDPRVSLHVTLLGKRNEDRRVEARFAHCPLEIAHFATILRRKRTPNALAVGPAFHGNLDKLVFRPENDISNNKIDFRASGRTIARDNPVTICRMPSFQLHEDRRLEALPEVDMTRRRHGKRKSLVD